MIESILSLNLYDHYTILNKLGEGTFASVFETASKITSQHYAVKQIYVQKPYVEEVKTEVDRLASINNDNVIKIIQSFYDDGQFSFNIVMELCKGSLRKQIEQRTVFDEDRLLDFLVQINAAFLQLEQQKMMHLDLKPQNILYTDEEGRFYKISDFGCSQISNLSKISGYEKNVFGTLNYLAPEIFLNYQGPKTRSSADIWSLGVVLYQMIFWRYPFPKKDDKENIDRDLATNYFQKKGYQINYNAMEGAPHSIINIVKLMLAPSPVDRINWTELKRYLMKEFKVQEHEFMSINEVVHNFIPIASLYLNVVWAISKHANNSSHLFWKSNRKFMLDFNEMLVYYCYIICQQFNRLFELKQKLVAVQQIQKINQLLQSLVQERQKCRDKLKSFETKSLCYRQTQLCDQLQVCIGKINTFKGNMEDSLWLLHTFCQDLLEIIRNDKSLFANQRAFDKSLKVKYSQQR